MGVIVFVLLAILVLFVASAALGLVFDLFVPVLIWALIGWLAGQLMRGRGYGVLGNVLLGVGGGIIGSIIFRLLNIGVGNVWLIGNIIVGVVGAVVLIWVVRTFSSNKSFGR
jgi:uncharacterized membrane protein YeaQ/YmgE (transglycosylase-associated protein family)